MPKREGERDFFGGGGGGGNGDMRRDRVREHPLNSQLGHGTITTASYGLGLSLNHAASYVPPHLNCHSNRD